MEKGGSCYAAVHGCSCLWVEICVAGGGYCTKMTSRCCVPSLRARVCFSCALHAYIDLRTWARRADARSVVMTWIIHFVHI